jgi:glycosyltransferase involved in cell wall biosynthesis
VDVARFDVNEPEVAAARQRFNVSADCLLFMGLYAYPPNRRAVDFLDREVMPRLTGQRLAVLGGAVPFERPWLVNPGVVPFGDLPAVVKGCGIGVAPIFEGSGTRLKILEYMAAGLPVVSTAKGAEGLAVADGENILIAEDGPGFVRAIEQLRADPNFAEGVARAGRSLVEQYDWRAIMAKVLPSFSEKGAIHVA